MQPLGLEPGTSGLSCISDPICVKICPSFGASVLHFVRKGVVDLVEATTWSGYLSPPKMREWGRVTRWKPRCQVPYRKLNRVQSGN